MYLYQFSTCQSGTTGSPIRFHRKTLFGSCDSKTGKPTVHISQCGCEQASLMWLTQTCEGPLSSKIRLSPNHCDWCERMMLLHLQGVLFSTSATSVSRLTDCGPMTIACLPSSCTGISKYLLRLGYAGMSGQVI